MKVDIHAGDSTIVRGIYMKELPTPGMKLSLYDQLHKHEFSGRIHAVKIHVKRAPSGVCVSTADIWLTQDI